MNAPLEPVSGPPPAPRGWRRLALLGPLSGRWTGQKCTAVYGCTALAIVWTPDGARCADHPPLPPSHSTGAKPAGWGYALDWTPKGGNRRDQQVLAMQAAIRHEPVPKWRPCALGTGRCYCGRCDHYTAHSTSGGGMGATDLRRQRAAGVSETHRSADGWARRDAGTRQAAAARPDWSVLAGRALEGLAKTRRPFTADDLVAAVGLPRASEANANNAVGAAFNAAAHAGLIARTGETTTSKRPEAHARRIAVWCGL